eukprot:gene23372-biopygen19330
MPVRATAPGVLLRNDSGSGRVATRLVRPDWEGSGLVGSRRIALGGRV